MVICHIFKRRLNIQIIAATFIWDISGQNLGFSFYMTALVALPVNKQTINYFLSLCNYQLERPLYINTRSCFCLLSQVPGTTISAVFSFPSSSVSLRSSVLTNKRDTG